MPVQRADRDARPAGDALQGRAGALLPEHRVGLGEQPLPVAQRVGARSAAGGAFTPDGRLISRYGDGAISHIDCHDIAACADTLLTGPARPGETFVLTGPEALTDAQLADRVGAALGHPVGRVTLTPDDFATALAGQGAPIGFAHDLADLLRGAANGSLAEVTTAVPELLGRPARTVDDFLRDNLPALRKLADGRAA
ncbi:hypothetical protein [Kitasatospora sp. NPDC059673]|uniref:hypothetical protein n=1 Tax=Kitasatospora sp. NPDC059673 TaxID=3346901 RepID=UPI00368AAC9D